MKCLICIKHFIEKTSKLTNQLLTAQSFFLYVCIINLSAVTLNISSIVQKQNHNWSSNSEYTCESLGTAVDSGATVAASAAQPTASSTGMIKNHVSLDFENTTFWSHLVTYLKYILRLPQLIKRNSKTRSGGKCKLFVAQIGKFLQNCEIISILLVYSRCLWHQYWTR